MTPGEWRHVRELFEAALEQAPTDSAWLDREAGAISRSAPTSLSLLDHHRAPDRFSSNRSATAWRT